MTVFGMLVFGMPVSPAEDYSCQVSFKRIRDFRRCQSNRALQVPVFDFRPNPGRQFRDILDPYYPVSDIFPGSRRTQSDLYCAPRKGAQAEIPFRVPLDPDRRVMQGGFPGFPAPMKIRIQLGQARVGEGPFEPRLGVEWVGGLFRTLPFQVFKNDWAMDLISSVLPYFTVFLRRLMAVALRMAFSLFANSPIFRMASGVPMFSKA